MSTSKLVSSAILILLALSTSSATSDDRWPGDMASQPPADAFFPPVETALEASFDNALAIASSQAIARKSSSINHLLGHQGHLPKVVRRPVGHLKDFPGRAEKTFWHGFDWLADNRCRFYGEGEVWFVDRNNTAHDQPLVLDTTLPPGQDVVLRVSDLDFNNQAGYRAMVGYCVDECTALEVGYLDLDWNAQAVLTGTNNLAIPDALGLVSLDFFNADRMQVDYSSALQSIEVNLVKKFCRANLLAGFRHLALDESFNIHPNDIQTGMSDYNIATKNDLFGVQIGMEIDRQCGRVGLDAVVKAGIYANDAEQRQFVMDFPSGLFLRDFATQGPVAASGTNAAFVGELGFSGTYDLTCNLTLRAGYNMVWIDGVALAPNQLDFTFTPTSGTTLLTGGGLFLHGASFGLEGRF